MLKSEKSFTLIELVIVIGILAVLAVVVILVINPVEFLKQSRDSQRLSELQDINKSLGLYQAAGNTDLGQTNKVYVSIPSAYSDCSDLGLPALPSNWFYACSNSTNYRKVDSNGWIPVNFTSISFGTPLNILPIDPINTTSTGNYYTYVIGGSWELNAILESSKYRNNTSITKRNLPGVFAVGSNLSLSPIFNNSGLVGYWKFDEGSGTTASDSSGNGNNGTLTSGPTWTTGKVNSALSFDGGDDYVSILDNNTLDFGTGDFTLGAWFYLPSLPNNWKSIINKGGAGAVGYGLTINTSNQLAATIQATGGTNQHFAGAATALLTGQWYHGVIIFDRDDKIYIYINGILKLSGAYNTGNTGSVSNSANPRIGSYIGDVFFLMGLIDDVRIYNRALSAAEIAAIYNATR